MILIDRSEIEIREISAVLVDLTADEWGYVTGRTDRTWAKISPWPKRSGVDSKNAYSIFRSPSVLPNSSTGSDITILMRTSRRCGHISRAQTSNASAASRGTFAGRQPLITRIGRGLYRRVEGHADDDPTRQTRPSLPAMRTKADDVDIEANVEKYLRDRDPGARYASFDYCFNHFQQHRAAVATWGEPTGMEVSCLQLGFYLASWGMLRGSSEMLQRSARHLVPLVETIANVPPAVWDLDLDDYDAAGIDLVTKQPSTFADRSARSRRPTSWSPK